MSEIAIKGVVSRSGKCKMSGKNTFPLFFYMGGKQIWKSSDPKVYVLEKQENHRKMESEREKTLGDTSFWKNSDYLVY